MKKLFGSGLALLVMVAPVLAAGLADYPSIFTDNGVPNYVIVVGKDAAPADVIGAVDLAVNLAGATSYTEKVVGVETATVEGKEYELAFGDSVGLGSDVVLTATRIPFFWRGEILHRGVSYITRELVEISANSTTVTNEWTKFNGTVYLTIQPNAIKYVYEFSSSPNASARELGYENPLIIKLLGEEYSIIDYSSDKITVMAGKVGTIDATTPLEFEGLKIYAIDGAQASWVKLQITDTEGNVLLQEIVNYGEIRTLTAGGKTFKVKPLQIWVSTITNTVTAKIVVGTEIDKDIISGDYFDEEQLWKFTIVANASHELKRIELTYSPTQATDIKFGEKLVAPNDYFEIGWNGYTVNSYATITFSIESVNVYKSDVATTAEWSGRPAIVVASDYPVFVRGTEEYDKVYLVIVNQTLGASETVLAYWDSTVDKVVQIATLNVTNKPDLGFDIVFDDTTLDVTWNSTHLILNPPGDVNNVTIAYSYDSGNDEIIMQKEDAEEDDVIVGTDKVGKEDYSLTTDYGIIIENVKANAEAERVVLKVPGEQQKAKIYVGKLGAVTGEEKVNVFAEFTAPVALLDVEVTDTDKSTKNFILVGGPAVNRLTAEVWGLTYPAYGAESTIPENKAVIHLLDSPWATGKKVLVVAGWEADHTRTAAYALMLHKDKLAGITADKVIIEGAKTLEMTITPVTE